MSSAGFPSLGVRVDAIGTEQATAKINKFGASVGRLPKDFQAASRATQKLGINMQKMSFAVFGASLAITSTVTSLSRLEKSALGVSRATVALERGMDLATRKQAALNRITQAGERFTGELALAQSELSTALADIIVKEEDLNIKTGEVTDTYINFAASLGASVLFSVTAFFSAIKGLEFAHVKAKFAAVGHAVANRVVTTSAIQASPALNGMTAATAGTTIAMIKATFAAHGLAAGLKAITLSFAPLIIALAVLTALWAVHESNILGTKTAIDKMLGITQEQTTATDEATTAQEGLNNAMAGPKGGLKSILDYLPTVEKLTFATTALAVATGQAATQQERFNEAAQTANVIGGRTVELTLPGGGTAQITVPEAVGGQAGNQRIPRLPILDFIQPLSATDQIKRLQQIAAFKDATKQALAEILELTKNRTEEEQRIIANQFIQENFHKDEIANAQQILSLLISQNRERAKAIDLSVKFKSVNPLFDFLFERGRVGQSTTIGRGAGGRAQIGGGSFGQGQFDQFLGFQSGVGSEFVRPDGTIMRSRLNNPNFGVTFGGGTTGAVNAFNRSSGGNFAAGGFASGGGGNGKGIQNTKSSLVAIAGTLLAPRPVNIRGGRVPAGFGGGLTSAQTDSKHFRAAQKLVENMQLAVTLGVITTAEMRSTIGDIGAMQQVAKIGVSTFAGFKAATIASARELGLDQILKRDGKFQQLRFGADKTSRFGKGFGRNVVQNNINTNAEFFAAAAIVKKERERIAFIKEAERLIDREFRFRDFVGLNPDVKRPEGTQLFMDVEPLAQALRDVLAGQDHSQFIKLLGKFKVL